MPNITLNTLAGISGLNAGNQVVQMTQAAHANDCGAYALVAATGAFGRPPVQANTAIAYNDIHGQLTSANTFGQLAASVYALTGILNPVMPPNPELVLNGGYNSPAALAQVALTLGRAVSVNITAAGFLVLGALYPAEQTRCNAVVGPANLHIGTAAAPVNYAAPGLGETQIVCVQTNGGSLHWLARGSDCNYYDPANGSLGNAWGNLQASGYTFTGLWLTLGAVAIQSSSSSSGKAKMP